jgi:hypothetical protein
MNLNEWSVKIDNTSLCIFAKKISSAWKEKPGGCPRDMGCSLLACVVKYI